MALEGNETPHILVFVDEAGFNLAKGRRRGRNIIGHRATVDVPGQRGANITMCAAISERGVATHIPSLGPYNTQKLLNFLDHLYTDLILENERGEEGPQLPHYVIVWDNVNFHRGPRIRTWFTTHPRMLMEFLPPYSPFLNPIEEFFSAWRWRVYEHQAQDQRALLHAMDAACEDITGDQCRGWLRHSRRFFLAASQEKISVAMWMRIYGLTESSASMARRMRMVARKERVTMATTENITVL
ncbi:Insertion element IS630 uncharacterized 39 kDa protein [Labeo rohita]|uniref:Insertion element IS630 uncharacterized 39 kDa protein n=1 Tax=Labeo rohita TaxID=84645 RepID=A0ABQ8MWR0_LABRO|nr:Insertion element IS630 uncharacterized 39 kDa protein [Labeo rohita]